AALDKASARLVGRWQAPNLSHAVKRMAVFEFAKDHTLKFEFTLHAFDKKETITGTWKAIEATGNENRIQVPEIDARPRMYIEFRSDQQIAFSFYSKTAAGVMLPATRLP